jgi:DNA-binding NarL/FixJ family response regulator
MIVDDEVFIRNLIKRVVSQAGVLLIAEASDTETARSGMGSFNPDVIILDINMPGESGLHLLKSIRTGVTSAERGLPVIILTGLGGENILRAALELDANAFNSKGDGLKKLKNRLNRTLTDPLKPRSAEIYDAVKLPDITEVAELADTSASHKLDGGGTRVSASQLNAGDTLPADLLTHNGQLLLTKGSVISEGLMKRITDIEETFGLRWQT